MKIVHFIIYKLCKSLNSQVIWKKLPATCTLYVALIICSACHFYWGCSQVPVWLEVPRGGSVTIISPGRRKPALVWQVRLDWGSQQATGRQCALQAQKKRSGLKMSPNSPMPWVTCNCLLLSTWLPNWFITRLLHSAEVEFTYLS